MWRGQIHVHIRPQAPASMNYTDGTASGVADVTTKNRNRGLLASRWFDSTHTKKKPHARIPRKSIQSDQCESRHRDATARVDATINNDVARLADGIPNLQTRTYRVRIQN